MTACLEFTGGPLEGQTEFPVPFPGRPFGYHGDGGKVVGVYRPDGDGKYKWDEGGQFEECGKMLPIFQAL